MPKIANATFAGESGEEYKFVAYSIDTTFKNVGAVYIFTKRTKKDGNWSHKFLYIGESEDLGDRIANHDKWDCVNENGANCICVKTVEDEDERLDIETNLINGNETPCNDQ